MIYKFSHALKQKQLKPNQVNLALTFNGHVGGKNAPIWDKKQHP